MKLCQTTLINTFHDNEHVFDVIDMAVAKLMGAVEFRHKIVLDEFVLSDILFDSIPAGMHWTELPEYCLLYTSPSPRDKRQSRMPSSA